MTEVFHINEEGQDAGVVYSEMQGRQNTIGDLVDLAYVTLLQRYERCTHPGIDIVGSFSRKEMDIVVRQAV